MSQRVKKGWEYVVYVILLLLLFRFLYQAALLNVDAHHDGTVFNPSLIVAKGGVLFRDTSTYYGPFMIYIQAFFLKIFGLNLSSLKFSAVVFYLLSYIMYFHIFKRIMPKSMVIVSEVVLFLIAPYWMVVFHAWSSVYALFFILAMVYLCIRFIEQANPIYAVLCGVSAALLLMLRTPVGLVFIAAGGVFWIISCSMLEIKRPKMLPLLQYGIGIVTGILPFLLTFLIQGTLKNWWDQCFMYAIRMIAPAETGESMKSAIESTLPVAVATAGKVTLLAAERGTAGNGLVEFLSELLRNLFPVKESGIFIVLPVVCLFVFFYLLYQFWQAGKREMDQSEMKKEFILMCIVWFCLASWHQYFPVSDRRHWYWAGFPMMGVVMYSIYYCLGNLNPVWRKLAAILFLFTISSNTIAERCEYYKVKKETYIYEVAEEEIPYMKGIKLSKEQLDFYEYYCRMVKELNEYFPSLAISNQTNLTLLDSLNHNDRIEIDKERAPFIVSFQEEKEGGRFPGYFNALHIQYSEEDFIPVLYDVYVYYPIDFNK